MSSPSLFAECKDCGRGAEACGYCEEIGMFEDWDIVCDCGLADFGRHLTDCEARTEFQYVIPVDPKQAQLKREAA